MMLFVQPKPPTPPTLPGQGSLTQAPVGGGPATPQLVSLEVLQAREATLAEQVSILQGQRTNVVRQLRARDPVMRSGALEQLKAVDAQLATAQTELSSVRAQMSLQNPRRNTRPGQTGPFQPEGRQGFNGEMVTGIIITFTIAVLMPISIGISRRLWRRTPAASTAPDIIAPRLDRLEHAVDAIAIEIERISEGQRFVTKVMTERPIQARHSAVASAESNDASSLGEAKPFLALGAGPVEPIRVADRQKVRQSNTPH